MITLFGGTDIGLVRESNQDRYEYAVLSGDIAFAVLCDGMGGHSGGSIASDTAARFISQMLRRDLRPDMSELSLRGVMEAAVSGANALVHDAAQKDPNLASMGTTLIVAVFYGAELYVSYVGDSRVYVLSPDSELQLTKDHTVVQMLVDMGEISSEDALSHPKRHYITRAIGVSPSVEADFLAHTLAPEEVALLCSDGLYNYLTPGSLYGLAKECAGEGGVGRLIDLARVGGGTDNITAVLAVRCEVPEGGAIHG